VVSGAVVEGGGVSIAAGAGGALTGAAAWTFFSPHPMQMSEIALASNARRARALGLRLGIYLFIFCKGRTEIANLSGDHVNSMREGQFDPEGGSAPYLRLKFYLTVV
jgi:hypothetical protein